MLSRSWPEEDLKANEKTMAYLLRLVFELKGGTLADIPLLDSTNYAKT